MEQAATQGAAQLVGQCSGAPDAEEDPSEQIGDFLSRLLTWVSLISREALTEAMVADSDAQAKQLMFVISAVFLIGVVSVHLLMALFSVLICRSR